MYDLLVLGSGPAGYYGAITAARAGKKVALVEIDRLGGTGFRYGCLPVKYMLDRVKKIEDVKEELGITSDPATLYGDIFMKNEKDMEGIEKKMKDSLEAQGVDIFFGHGRFVDEHTYRLDHEVLEAKNIVLATGTRPAGIMDITLDYKVIISHKEAIQLKELPKELMIIGGNVEGIEFASLFAHLGTKVTVIEKEDTILLGNDEDLIQPLRENLVSLGVTFITGMGAIGADVQDGRGQVTLEDGRKLIGDRILVTGFRQPNIPGGIEDIGVVVQSHKIPVDEYLRTNLPHIYAIGDINGILGMAHVAISQGSLILRTMEQNEPVPMNYKSLPRAIFTVGEIAGTGYQEWELVAAGMPYTVKKTYFHETWRGFNKGHEEDFIKVMIDEDDRVLGIWMYGHQVGEMVGSLGLLLDKKVSATEIEESLYVHPTLSEALLESILKYKS